jgi:predicted Rossmann-fold nucleotide-binding protein
MHYYIENDLRRRKERFEELSNSILILPGGFGTLDEMIEMITRKIWEDLSIPIIIFNYNGYFNELLNMFENIQMNKFGKDYKEYIMIVNDFDELNNILQKLKL